MSEPATEIAEPAERLIPVEDIDAAMSDPVEAAARPCPFCGSAARFAIMCGAHVAADGGSWAHVVCDNCDVFGPNGRGAYRDAACHDAVRRWNERKPNTDD